MMSQYNKTRFSNCKDWLHNQVTWLVGGPGRQRIQCCALTCSTPGPGSHHTGPTIGDGFLLGPVLTDCRFQFWTRGSMCECEWTNEKRRDPIDFHNKTIFELKRCGRQMQTKMLYVCLLFLHFSMHAVRNWRWVGFIFTYVYFIYWLSGSVQTWFKKCSPHVYILCFLNETWKVGHVKVAKPQICLHCCCYLHFILRSIIHLHTYVYTSLVGRFLLDGCVERLQDCKSE